MASSTNTRDPQEATLVSLENIPGGSKNGLFVRVVDLGDLGVAIYDFGTQRNAR